MATCYFCGEYADKDAWCDVDDTIVRWCDKCKQAEYARQLAVLLENGYDYKYYEMLERNGEPMPIDHFNANYSKKREGF